MRCEYTVQRSDRMVWSGPPRGSVGPGAKYRFGGPDDVIMSSSADPGFLEKGDAR